MAGKLLSIQQYAALTGKDPGNIRRHCISGRLPAIKVGNQWCIDEEEPYPADKRYKDGSYVDRRKRYSKATD